jgi:hypothetical protein
MRKLFVSVTLILAVAGGLYWFNSNIAAPASVAINETATEKQLSECQLYYRDVFSNAKEYATFEDYPATTTYTGPSATVDEASHAVAKRFYSYHVAALEKGVTFAGKYTISDWAYTGLGQMFAVVDVETGEVYPFPYVVDWEFDFKPDSNLIVINPKDSVPAFDKLDGTADVSCDVKWFDDMKTYYFVFENNEFRLLGPEDTSGLATSSWLSYE